MGRRSSALSSLKGMWLKNSAKDFPILLLHGIHHYHPSLSSLNPKFAPKASPTATAFYSIALLHTSLTWDPGSTSLTFT